MQGILYILCWFTQIVSYEKKYGKVCERVYHQPLIENALVTLSVAVCSYLHNTATAAVSKIRFMDQ